MFYRLQIIDYRLPALDTDQLQPAVLSSAIFETFHRAVRNTDVRDEMLLLGLPPRGRAAAGYRRLPSPSLPFASAY